jgi:hypothetical protein
MVHKSSVIPGLSQFLDSTVLSQYPPTSMKRIVAAGALALFLKQNSNVVDTILNNPMVSGLGVTNSSGMINLDLLRETFKSEIAKAGFMRINFPMLGDVDFTTEDLDALYNAIVSIDKTSYPSTASATPATGGLVIQ